MSTSGIQMHIDDVSRNMGAWLRSALPDVDITFVSRFPATDEEGEHNTAGARPRIEICFQSITEEKPDRALPNRDDAFLLTYLLRVTGGDALANQHVYSQVYFTAHENGDFRVAFPGGRPATTATGNADRMSASLFLTARLVRPSEATTPGIVAFPLDLHLRSLGRLVGRVVAQDGTPIMHAEINAHSLNRRVASDASGRFTIPGAPAEGTVSLKVTARGKCFNVMVDTEKQAEVVIVMPKENENA